VNDHISITGAVEQLDSLLLRFEQLETQLDPGFMRRMAEAIHYALVVLDDFLCSEFGFNRWGRGKYDKP